jgi:predicted Zn finger-like uncharacterized protein
MNLSFFECPHCSAFYRVSLVKICERRRASAKCVVCHKIMLTWNSPRVPSFTLAKRVDVSRLSSNE